MLTQQIMLIPAGYSKNYLTLLILVIVVLT